MKKNKKMVKESESNLKENLKDPVYVNYNILLKLEEIKQLLGGIYQALEKKERGEDRQGTFR